MKSIAEEKNLIKKSRGAFFLFFLISSNDNIALNNPVTVKG
jgi:hypothetical protein